MDIETGVGRLRRRLRDLIEDSDVPRRRIDRRLGHARGYVSQLLAGTIDLKYRHLIAILQAIECPPQRFFEEAFPLPDPPPESPRSPSLDTALNVDRDVVGIYGFGIDTVRRLRRRLERCEAALFAAYPQPGRRGEGS